jgi:hypothetical protein
VQSWYESNLELCGFARRAARVRIAQVLGELQLLYLAARTFQTLSPIELFAVRVGFALAPQPAAVFVFPTAGEPEYASYEQQLLDYVAGQCRLLVGCDPVRHFGLLARSEQAACVGARSEAQVFTPSNAFPGFQSYLVTALQNLEQLENGLRSRGVVIHNSGSNELLLSLAASNDTRLLVDAALEADAPLVKMIPLPRV